MRLNWKNDDDAIVVINQLGLKWERSTISVSSVDVELSKHNHARKEAIITSNVEDYADGMMRGDVFPMIVVAKIDGRRLFVIAGGNHRYAAAVKSGVREIDVIVVECDSTMFYILCPKLNLYVGQREDRAQRILQAADSVTRLGVTAKKAADDFRVPASSVSHAVNESKVVVEAAKLGIRADGMSSAYLRAMTPIIGDAAMLPLAIELAKTKINAEDVRVAVKTARAMPTEAQRVEFLKEKVQDAKKITAGGRIERQQTRASITRSITTLDTFVKENCTLCQLQMTRDETTKAIETMRKIATRMMKALSEDGKHT